MEPIDLEIKRIIDEKRIVSVFQPIVSLRDCKILGYEALSRIKGSSIITNSEELFYRASTNGMVWQLEQLCRQNTFQSLAKEFDTKYKKLLFLNVSPSVINDKDFREGFTKKYVDTNHISPSQIIFEITEHEAITDMCAFLKALEHYRSQMYKIAIDDIGSGYSSLGLICDVHPQYAKIDMRLIRDIHKNQLQYAMVKSLAELAEAANINLIAEGIETIEEMNTLIKLNIPYGQGYYFAKPSSNFSHLRNHVETVRKEVKKSNNLYNRTCHYGIDSFCIKNVTSKGLTIPSTMRVKELYDIFKQDSHLTGVTIVSDNQCQGIITRNHLDHKLSGQYGFTLFQNKEVISIMDNTYLEVDCSSSIKDVSDMAMHRHKDNIYDFIVVTKNDEYYGVVSVKDILLKSMEIAVFVARDTNPLTGLPGNHMVIQKISSCITSRSSYSILYLDIDNFKAYNDSYGFSKGDTVIKALADSLRDLTSDTDFIGHIGGDDFIVILGGFEYTLFFTALATQFSVMTRKLYSETDQENGYIVATNRKGILEKFPLVSLTAAVVSNKSDTCQTSNEIMKLLSKRKKTGKHVSGNSLISK